MGRHRLFLVITFLTILSLLLILCISYSNYARSPKFFSTRQITVGNGETLWHIAKREYPNANIQEIVHHIRELNGITDPGKLRVGQVIELPVFFREAVR